MQPDPSPSPVPSATAPQPVPDAADATSTPATALRIVVVGGDAAGMSAAGQALRTAARAGRPTHVTVLERGDWVSYSACGLPYWLAGDTDGPDALVARTPARHRATGMDLQLGADVRAIDPEGRTVTVHHRDGRVELLHYDRLVLATGARPIRPPVPGMDLPGVEVLHTLDDGAALNRALVADVERAVVVGAGYIGIEVAEALHRRGVAVTLVERDAEVMATLDADLAAEIRQAMSATGIDVRCGTTLEACLRAPGDRPRVGAVRAGGEIIPADLVVVAVGVTPRDELARAAGLAVGPRGGILVDRTQQAQRRDPATGGLTPADDIWAAGDCTLTHHRLLAADRHIALGTHANKQGRVVGSNVIDPGATHFPGVVGTAVTRFLDLEIGRTGLTLREAAAAGIDAVAGTVSAPDRAGYMPGAGRRRARVVAERGTGRLLGAQVTGPEGTAKRIDVVAIALWQGMTAAELEQSDLGYAPPLSPVWDILQLAARKADQAAAVPA